MRLLVHDFTEEDNRRDRITSSTYMITYFAFLVDQNSMD